MIPVSLCTTFLPDIPVLRAEIPAMAVTENVTYASVHHQLDQRSSLIKVPKQAHPGNVPANVAVCLNGISSSFVCLPMWLLV